MIKFWTQNEFYARIQKDFGLTQELGPYSKQAKPRCATYWRLASGKVISVSTLDDGEQSYTTWDYQRVQEAVVRQGGQRIHDE